jgi:hypothetical protein
MPDGWGLPSEHIVLPDRENIQKTGEAAASDPCDQTSGFAFPGIPVYLARHTSLVLVLMTWRMLLG